MAGPVRLAYRSREAGEGGIDVCARARPPRPRGRWVRCIRSHVIARPVPPAPRSSAVVDPRIGDLGPALLALEDGSVFPGVAFGAPIAAGGDLVVNTSQTGYQEVCTDPSYAGQVVVMTYPLIGNYGRLLDDDQSIRPWLRGAGRRQRHRRGPRRRPPARRAAARRRRSRPSPASTPAPSPATCGRTAACAGSSPRPARSIRTRPWRAPGPCRAGRTRTSSARSRRRPITDVGAAGRRRPADRRSSTSGSRTNIVAVDAPPRRPRPGPAAHASRAPTSSPPTSTA